MRGQTSDRVQTAAALAIGFCTVTAAIALPAVGGGFVGVEPPAACMQVPGKPRIMGALKQPDPPAQAP